MAPPGRPRRKQPQKPTLFPFKYHSRVFTHTTCLRNIRMSLVYDSKIN